MFAIIRIITNLGLCDLTCVDASESTLQHSIMDDVDQIARVLLVMKVLKLDVWAWLYKNDVGFTF